MRAPEAAPLLLPPPLPPLTSRLAPPNSPPKNIRAGTACTRTAWLRAWLLSAPRQTAALDRAATRAAAVQDAISIGSKCGWFAGPQRGASDWGRPSAAQQQGQRPKLAVSIADHGLGLSPSATTARRATMAAARVGRQARCSSTAPRPLATIQQAVGGAAGRDYAPEALLNARRRCRRSPAACRRRAAPPRPTLLVGDLDACHAAFGRLQDRVLQLSLAQQAAVADADSSAGAVGALVGAADVRDNV